MAPKRLTKAKSLQFPFATKRLYNNPMAKAHALTMGLTANPGGDYSKDDPTPPLALIEPTPSSVSSHVSGTMQQKNGTSPPGARLQANTSPCAVQEQLPDTQSDQPYIPPQRRRWAGRRSLGFSGESPTPTVHGEMPPPPLPPPRRSERTTKGNLPMLPLDIEIGVDQPRGTKRSAAIAAHSDHSDKAPNEDLSGDGEPGPRKVATPIERPRLPRYPFLYRIQRRRIDDDPNTAEAAATDDLWVAVGEERCDPCKLVGREVCKPQWDESSKPPCTSCVFCTGKSWSCNPSDSWLEKAGTKLRPKQAPPKSHQGVSAGDATPIKVGKISKTGTETSPPTTEVEVVKSQSGHEKGGNVAQMSLNNDDRTLRIETRLSSIEGQLEGLGAIQRTQQEMRAMLQGLCRHQGFAPSLRTGFSTAALTRSTVPSPLAYSLGIRNAGRGDKEPSQNIGGPSSVPRSSAQVDVGLPADPEKAPPKSTAEPRLTQGSASADVEEEISAVTRDLDRILGTLETLIGQIVIISTKLQAIRDDSDLG